MKPELPLTKLSIVVLISGNGSNLQAILDAIAAGLPAQIKAVISDQADAYGLQRALKANIPTEIIKREDAVDNAAYNQTLLAAINKYHPELVVLSGFMRIIGSDIIKHYRGRIINIHPSLLPEYKGLHTYARALAAQEKQHGTTVHFVTDELDAGPIIAQATLDILPDDTAASLKQRTQALEHQLYPQVIRGIALGEIRLTDRGVYISGEFK